jgi:hypothetical protein
MKDVIFPPESWTTMKDSRIKRNEYFDMLRVLKFEQAKSKSSKSFSDYVEEQVGIRIQFVSGMITGDYTIVDEEKYFLYKLKQ